MSHGAIKIIPIAMRNARVVSAALFMIIAWPRPRPRVF
jgi:hypothetical protein